MKKKNWIIGLLILAVVVLIGMEGLAHLIVSLAKPSQSHSRVFDLKYYLAKQPPTTDKGGIILLGDSFTLKSVFTELLDTRLKEKGIHLDVRNLANPRGTPAMNIELLKTAMDSGVKPKLVIYNINLAWFNSNFFNNPEISPQDDFEKSYLGQCVMGKPHNILGSLDCTVSKYSYIVRFRNYWQDLLKHLDRMVFGSEKQLRYTVMRENTQNTVTTPLGWSPHYPMFTSEEFDKEFAWRPGNDKKTGQPSDGNYKWDTSAVTELVDFCNQNKIPLLIVWYPQYLDKAYLKAYGSKESEEFEARFKKFAARPNTWFLDMHNSDKDVVHFYNPSHLNLVGAMTFTEALAKKLETEPYRSLLR